MKKFLAASVVFAATITSTLSIATAQSVDTSTGVPTYNGIPVDNGCYGHYADISPYCPHPSSSPSVIPDPYVPPQFEPAPTPLPLYEPTGGDAFGSAISAKIGLLKALLAKGIPAFFPLATDTEGNPVCNESHAQPLLSEFCACDTGYLYDAKSDACVQPPAPVCAIHSHPIPPDQQTKYPTAHCFCDPGYKVNAQNTGCELASTQPTAETVPLPPDVSPDAWYAAAVSVLLLKGDFDTVTPFRPTDLATRSEFVHLLVQNQLQDGSVPDPTKASFDDIPTTSPDYAYFEEAAKQGWITGTGNCYGTHPCLAHPDSPLNRAEVAALLFRAFGLRGVAKTPQFTDNPAGQWYTQPILNAAGHCILQGDSGTSTVRPTASINRAEMAVMLYRASLNLSYPECH